MQSIIFFGTDFFSVSILSTLIENNKNILAVVTKPDKIGGRDKKMLPPPVKKFLLENKIDLPLFQPEKASTHEFAQILKSYNPDLFVVVSYGEIISSELLSIPKLMPINIHPSFLPKYRGASPLRSALLNGDKEIGIAIIEMVKAMDAGDILALKELKVLPNENHSSLETRVFMKAGELVLKCLESFEKNTINKTPQIGEVTFTKKITNDLLKIDWTQGVDQIINKIRAFGEAPGAYCQVMIGDKLLRLKILEAEKKSNKGSNQIKTLSFSKDFGWEISLLDGEISILKVQLENKKIANIKEFINGLRGAPPVMFF
jgi:methionyl-tRNA formyltransferase